MIYVLTGPVGSGKSLMATQRVIDYAARGCKVAANYHIDLSAASNRRRSALSQTSVRVLPAVVGSGDLFDLGVGGPSEEKAGLVVIDEAGVFLNARSWNQEDRQKIIKWMLLSRKLRWDMILIVQAVGILDKQIREAVVEVCGRIRRTDRIKIPGTGIKLPRAHVAMMRYGTNPQDVIIERWWARGAEAFKCYDTTCLFGDDVGAYTVPSPVITKWRHVPLNPLERLINLIRPYPVGSYAPRPSLAPVRKPKNRVAALLSSLPPDQAIKHWHRFNRLGAFPVGNLSIAPAL